jgi:uncharacterized membrane protein required for colicin V production
MLFWLCLIIGLAFAWLGFKKGFFVAIAMLLNLMFGIYVGVLATPRILNMNSEYSDSGYYAAATMMVLAMAIFTVLQGIAWFYLLRDREDYFPKLIEQVAGGLCGFLFGYFLLGLFVLAICMMPFSRADMPSFLPKRDNMARFASTPILSVCNFIGGYSLECFDGEPQAVLDGLLTLGKEKNSTPSPSDKG